MMNDVFGRALSEEMDNQLLGREEGRRHGRAAGVYDGRLQGLNFGYDLGYEIGIVSGYCSVWRQVQEREPGNVSERAERALAQLEQLLMECRLDCALTDVEALQASVRAVRSKFKLAMSLFGPQRFEPHRGVSSDF